MSVQPPDGFEWLDDPVTIAVADHVQRIAEAVYPTYPLSRAKTKVWQAIRDGSKAKKNPLRLISAPPPFPEGHVFTEEFFRWLAIRWRNKIPWLHPHYGRILVNSSCVIKWSNAKSPPQPPTYDELQREVQRLGTENKELSAQLRREQQRAEIAEKELKRIKDRAKAAYAKKAASGNFGGRHKTS